MNAVQDALERGRSLIDKAGSVAELQAVEADAVGKRSDLATITASLRELPPADRAELGRAVQVARAHLEELFEQRTVELGAREARQRAEAEKLDLSEVGGLFAAGSGPLAETLAQPAREAISTWSLKYDKNSKTYSSPWVSRWQKALRSKMIGTISKR